MVAQVGPAEITCQPGEQLHSLTCPLLSRQTKFNQRERPSGNRLESPAYQALVKLSDFLPWWGNDSCSYPGLACPTNLPMSASSGQNLGEPNPSVSASGQSAHLV